MIHRHNNPICEERTPQALPLQIHTEQKLGQNPHNCSCQLTSTHPSNLWFFLVLLMISFIPYNVQSSLTACIPISLKCKLPQSAVVVIIGQKRLLHPNPVERDKICHTTFSVSCVTPIDRLGLSSKVHLVRVPATVCGFLTGTASRASLTTGTGVTGRGRVLGRRTVAGALAGGTGSCGKEESD